MKRDTEIINSAINIGHLVFAIVLALIMVLAFPLIVVSSPTGGARADVVQRYVATSGDDTGNDCSNLASPCKTIRHAITQSSEDDILNVAGGTYTETGQIVVSKTLSIIGSSEPISKTIIKPGADTSTDAGDGRGWLLVETGVRFNLSQVVLDGSGKQIMQAIRSHGSGTIENNEFRNIENTLLSSPPDPYGYPGTAIFLDTADTVIRNNAFQDIGRVGVLACGDGTRATVTGNTYMGKNRTDQLDYAVWVGGGAAVTITNNTITNNIGEVILPSAGIRVDSGGNDFFCLDSRPSSAVIESNTILSSSIGIHVGRDENDYSIVTANFNRIVGNTLAGIKAGNDWYQQDARYNWWGCNAGPGASGCDEASGNNIDTSQQLQLEVTPLPAVIQVGQTSSISATITSGAGHVPDNTSVLFRTDGGSLGSSSVPKTFAGGIATATLTADGWFGIANVSATVDKQTVSQTVTIHRITVLLPLVFRDLRQLVNGDFENGLTGWDTGWGPFQGNGTGIQPVVNNDNGGNQALIGDPDAPNLGISVGYGYMAQTITVQKNLLELQYRLTTYDIAKEGTQTYYDTFEISLNKPPEQITNADRNNLGCPSPDQVSQNVVVQSDGLAFCVGGEGDPGTERNYPWKAVNLDLTAYTGQNVTLYLALWSREYYPPFKDDHAYHNTWVYIDNVKPIE